MLVLCLLPLNCYEHGHLPTKKAVHHAQCTYHCEYRTYHSDCLALIKIDELMIPTVFTLGRIDYSDHLVQTKDETGRSPPILVCRHLPGGNTGGGAAGWSPHVAIASTFHIGWETGKRHQLHVDDGRRIRLDVASRVSRVLPVGGRYAHGNGQWRITAILPALSVYCALEQL